MNIEKLMQDIKAVRVGRYGCTLEDIAVIRDASGGGALQTGANCFLFGFLQGQKAERAAAKKRALEARRREMKKEAPGCGLLMALYERNKDNERFVNLMCARAKALEGNLKNTGKDVHHDG